MSVFIIAEAGVNHNGSVEMAIQLADEAHKAGADCVKFQTFKASELASRCAKRAAYQNKTVGDGSQIKMLKSLELSYDEFITLKKHCDEIGICFLSTPFDRDSIVFLEELDMPFWKIPSGEVTNFPYLRMIAQTHKDVVMSTGMCNMSEIQEALSVLKTYGTGNIVLMHCNTEYPTPYEDVNLKAMNTIKNTFGYEVGYSDHTCGIEIPIAAVAMGAVVIEKHFTLSRKLDGPDHKASLQPEELREMVSDIRHLEAAMGTGEKTPSPSERKNIDVARRSIVAGKKINKGEVFTEDNLKVKRPGGGISPMRWLDILGKTATRDYEFDEMISEKL